MYFVAIGLFLASCGEAPKTSQEAGEVKEASAETLLFTVDTDNSVLQWEGAKLTETVHYGVVQISDGNLWFKEGELEAGSFIVDMATIENHDLDEDSGKGRLEGHLMSADFFNVEEYPTASFEITDVSDSDSGDATHQLSGNLTIKGITNGITFPAHISLSGNTAEASASFEINRNEWDVVWGGSKTDQSIKDMLQNNLIKDVIVFNVKLVANHD